MSRIRDIANLFSANTDAATDAEVASAISAHNTSANGHVKRGNTASRPASPSTGDVYANTQTGFLEVYDSTYGWEQIGAIASTPSDVVATNQGSGRDYDDGQASVAFSSGTVMGRLYTITPSPSTSPATFSGSSSPITVTGLQSSTQYTYTVTATNNYGTSAASAASAGVTATTVPQAPTIGTATAGDTQASVAFTANATGGSAITSYTVTSSPGNITASGASSPIIVTGLTNETAYTFTVTATNANGTSTSSSASDSIVVGLLEGYNSIASTTLATDTATITFSNIPQGYDHLEIHAYWSGSNLSNNNWLKTTFNGDTGANYAVAAMRGDGVTEINTIGTFNYLSLGSNAENSNVAFAASVAKIFDYSKTSKAKSTQALTGSFKYTNNTKVSGIWWGSWNNTAAINSITITGDSSFLTNSVFALYGVK